VARLPGTRGCLPCACVISARASGDVSNASSLFAIERASGRARTAAPASTRRWARTSWLSALRCPGTRMAGFLSARISATEL
jgi:hypothetical protein